MVSGSGQGPGFPIGHHRIPGTSRRCTNGQGLLIPSTLNQQRNQSPRKEPSLGRILLLLDLGAEKSG
jgi:hypothetical protein